MRCLKYSFESTNNINFGVKVYAVGSGLSVKLLRVYMFTTVYLSEDESEHTFWREIVRIRCFVCSLY